MVEKIAGKAKELKNAQKKKTRSLKIFRKNAKRNKVVKYFMGTEDVNNMYYLKKTINYIIS